MAAHVEGALQVHGHHRVPVLLRHVEDHPVAQDAGVVDHDVELAEGVERALDDALGGLEVGHAVAVRDRLAAPLLDLGDHLLGGRGRRRPGAVEVRAEIVHDDLCAVPGEEQRLLAADASARARDDRDLAVEQHRGASFGDVRVTGNLPHRSRPCQGERGRAAGGALWAGRVRLALRIVNLLIALVTLASALAVLVSDLRVPGYREHYRDALWFVALYAAVQGVMLVGFARDGRLVPWLALSKTAAAYLFLAGFTHLWPYWRVWTPARSPAWPGAPRTGASGRWPGRSSGAAGRGREVRAAHQGTTDPRAARLGSLGRCLPAPAAQRVTRSRRGGRALYRALPAPNDETTPQEVGPEARDDCGEQQEGAPRRDEHGEGHQRAELDVEAEAREAERGVAEGDRGGGEEDGLPRRHEGAAA